MGSLKDWNLRHFDHYCDQLARGLHDDQCEQQERSSLCHCSKRRREAAGKTELPTLEFSMPICSGCGEECDHDGDRLVCPRCQVAWSSRKQGDLDPADHFTDDYGDLKVREQFGKRLIVLATEENEPWTSECPGTYQDGGDLGSVCDTCGDMGNSTPGLPCGRVESERD